MNELDMLRNIVVNNGNFGREGLLRHWKGLRKFNSVGQLQRSGFLQYPPHVHRRWSNNDRVDRPDKELTTLPKNRDTIWVDDFLHVNVEVDYQSEPEDQNTRSLYVPFPPSPRTPGESVLNSSGDQHSFRAKLTPQRDLPSRRRRARPSSPPPESSLRQCRRRHSADE